MLAALLATALAATPPDAPPVDAPMDWQAHPAMHIPWPMFGKGLTDRPLQRRTWRHQFRQTVTRPNVEASGVRLMLAAAMAAERARNPAQATRLIEEQLDYLEAFIAAHPERHALARTPAEARRLLTETDKVVWVHSIEGAHHLLSDPGAAQRWADRGVALVTLIHLRDDEFGGAGLLEGWQGPFVNPRGARAERKGARRGLTERGREAIVELDDAGILVDMAHMAPETLDDALAVTAQHDMPPVVTHGVVDGWRSGKWAVQPEQVLEIYRQGGIFAMGLSALDLQPEFADDPPAGRCWGTVEAWAWHQEKLQALLAAHADELLAPGEDQTVRLSTGWSSDWNGWVSHSGPTHGPRGCRPGWRAEVPMDTRGLAHPGDVPDYLARVAALGVDRRPLDRSTERFLQLWAGVRGE